VSGSTSLVLWLQLAHILRLQRRSWAAGWAVQATGATGRSSHCGASVQRGAPAVLGDITATPPAITAGDIRGARQQEATLTQYAPGCEQDYALLRLLRPFADRPTRRRRGIAAIARLDLVGAHVCATGK